MSAPAVGGLASVIVPCWNQLEFTRKRVAALMRQTGPNWGLLVVDNGSDDGTADYLSGVQDVSPVPVTVISNATNRGFPAAINQGLQYARGEYLVLLNNDVVVTEGWLGQLIGLANIKVERKHEIPSSKSEMVAGDGGPVESRTYPGRNITVIDLAREDQGESVGRGVWNRCAGCLMRLSLWIPGARIAPFRLLGRLVRGCLIFFGLLNLSRSIASERRLRPGAGTGRRSPNGTRSTSRALPWAVLLRPFRAESRTRYAQAAWRCDRCYRSDRLDPERISELPRPLSDKSGKRTAIYIYRARPVVWATAA
jgi:glycosyltransferase involved in cell wall biosynthesis